MHARDSGAGSKAALSSALSPALAPALALTLVLGWGLTDASFRDPQGSLTEQAVPLVPAIAIPARDATDVAPSVNGWQEGREEREHMWRQEVGNESTAIDASACGGDCLEALRQRLLDHHRQAAPVWVF